ncbi:MAG: pyridoxamine kinase [Clostridia bacterium]|nr:pyridoxamine kinase [Clostridia bacterium]
MMKQKRVVTIQDISCLGKCSLTVALHILSAMNTEACVIPTAMLSTHTGGFSGYTFRDLTEDIVPILDHWEAEGFDFDAIYTGYLGSAEQCRLMLDLFERFGTKDNLIFVDPAMADNGKLYAGFSSDFPQEMKKVCAAADVIDPNLTEACLMLGIDYPGKMGYTEEWIKDVLKQLCAMGCRIAILTGVIFGDKQGAMAYDSSTDTYSSYFGENLPVAFHGTGDVFSSALCGALVRNQPMERALKTAVDFTVEAIKISAADPDLPRYGVRFEAALPELIQNL